MKKQPGLAKAIDYVNKGLKSRDFDERFPSIQALARAADVSFVTMWKAVDYLKKCGTLMQLRKKSRYAAAKTASAPTFEKPAPFQPDKAPLAITLPLWEKTTSLLRKDILTGRFSFGVPLPSMKGLQNSYNVSFPTLKKALDKLWSEGTLVTHRRGYAVPSFSKSKSSARIAAIGCGWEDGTLWVDHQDKNYFRILEAECIKSRIALDIVVYYRKNGKLCFIDSVSRAPYDFSNSNIISSMYIIANLEIPPEEVLRYLVHFKRPIAVLDVVGGWELSSRIANSARLQFFTATTSRTPPRDVARFLLSLGHTSIAFISPFHKALWSKRRRHDIAEVYRAAGYSDNVFTFAYDQYGYQWNYLQEDNENADNIKTLIADYDKWQKQSDSGIFRKFGNIRYAISRYLTEWNCATGEIYHRMVPLFENALANRKITAWVMANDYSAMLAFDFLKEKGIRIPDDLSIISFDNTPDAIEYQLTSYDFNLNGIISMMLNYAIRPSILPRSEQGAMVEIGGTIIERRSTACGNRLKPLPFPRPAAVGHKPGIHSPADRAGSPA